MKKKVLFIFPALLFLGSSCVSNESVTPPIDDNQNNEEDQNGDNTQKPQEPELTEEEKLEKFRNDILALGKGASKCVSTVEQTDGYGDLTVEAIQKATSILYSNDFKREEFESSMSSTKINGVKETGIVEKEGKKLYQICDFTEDDGDDSVAYMNYSDELKDINLDVGFSFLMNTSVFLPYDQSQDVTNLTYTFSYNFTQDNIDLTKDGKVTLSFESIAKQGVTEFERYQFQSEITIESGKITKANVVMKESIMGDANYRFLEGEYIYYYEEITEFTGTKLDPSNYKVPSTN